MDVSNGHDWRETSLAPSSSSDFYSTESTPRPAPPAVQDPAEKAMKEPVPGTGEGLAGADDRDGEREEADSSSDMDLSEPSRPPTPACALHAKTVAHAGPTTATVASHAGDKRKISDAEIEADGSSAVTIDEQTKKRKVDSSHMPRFSTAIWQRIFSLLPPAMLCRCLSVCKDFHDMLTATKAPRGHSQQKDKSTARIVDSEAIWTHSRKTFFPQLPRPLRQHTELEMLKLVGGQNCQFCGKTSVASPATSLFNCGPGADGVRVIFPFGVRTCGPCIEPLLRKDVQLLAEPTSARLRLGISHAFRNEEYHFVTETVRQMPTGIPGNLRFSKVYYHPHLVAIKQEEDDAQQLGQGAADEWRKGLYNKGKDAMADSARWEKWEAQLRLGVNLAQVLREYDSSSFPHRVQELQSKPAGVSTAQLPLVANGPHPLPQPVHVFHNGYPPPFPQYQQLPRPPLSQKYHLPHPPHPSQHHLPYPPQQPQPHRLVRNPQEVESARQARKAEIERRCQELEPPVTPNVLQHMESFQAAMQITTPLNPAAWDMLKTRILAQREAAELAEHARASQLAALQAAMPSSSEDIVSKPAKEVYDREYEDAQMPLRKRLGEYADDIINGQWVGGKTLGKDNVPIFAIQVLLHVRQRYTEDRELGLLPDFEAPTRAIVNKEGSPPTAPFLSLDNMKWVYDNKVRPFTDIHRKEHFICGSCEHEKKAKWFAFEGLIQHYGAKHTSAFSKGNIVVHWQTAEWPETPPFHTNPAHWLRADRVKAEFKRAHHSRSTAQNQYEGSYQDSFGEAVNDPASQPAANTYQSNNQVASQASASGHSRTANQQATMQAGRETQHLQLATDSREIWDALDGVPDMLECVKVQAALHHALTKFVERYHHTPSPDLLTDALVTHNSMRPIKNVAGLACKKCVADGPNSHSNSYWTRIRGAKSYTTSYLVNHLKLSHPSQPANWLTDMIELPEAEIVEQLLRAPGMDDGKLALIAVAFPTVFPTPLPRIGHITEDRQQQSASEAPVSSLFGRLNKKQKGNAKKKGPKAANGTRPRDDSNEPLPKPNEDEYDPMRPALVPTQSYDPAQFDTDARKPSVPEVPVAQSSSLISDLAPDTIAMLQSLAQSSHDRPATTQCRTSRSPSVGRAESAIGMPNSASSGQPDIGAILAALTGQGQVATPQVYTSNKPESLPLQPTTDDYGKAGREAHASARNGSHAAPANPNGALQTYPHPPTGSGTRESQAIQSHGYQRFERNPHVPYADHTPSAAQRPQYQAAPQYQAPPQYQYVYEDNRSHGQIASHAPVYREPPAPQYVKVPDHEYPPHGYQYERAPSKPIYVDQYGRPLIPVDAAPAPIQYVPSPYEQQHQYGVHPVYAPVAAQPHLQPVYDDRRPVYYEQPANAGPPQYSYEERASVGRP